MKKATNGALEDYQIIVHNEQSAVELDAKQLDILVETALACIKNEGIKQGCEVCILLTDDGYIRQLNRQFRNIDNSTDVLSFPMNSIKNGEISSQDGSHEMDGGLLMLGDIAISAETALKQAELFGHSLERELAFLVSHGMLHILGYNHTGKEEESVMLLKQEAALKVCGLDRIKTNNYYNEEVQQ